MLMEWTKMARKDHNKPRIKKPWESQIPIRNCRGERIERKQLWIWADRFIQPNIAELRSGKFPVVIISRYDNKDQQISYKALKIIKEHCLCKINHYDIGSNQFVITFKDEESAVTFKLLWDENDD